MAKELVYYKKNVNFTVIVRRHPLDAMGYSLNQLQPWIAVDVENLRDFKMANKKSILEGLISVMEAPDVDWQTPNELSNEEITELLKNYTKLRSALKSIDSIATLNRILETAKEQDKSEKTKRLIEARIEEIGDDIISPDEMQRVTN